MSLFASLPHELRDCRPVIRRSGSDRARAAHFPAVVGEDVIDAAIHPRMRRTDLFAAKLRGVEFHECFDLVRVRSGVEIARENVRIAARAHMPREADELLGATFRVEFSPRREMRDIETDRRLIDANDTLDHRSRLADRWQ